MGTTEENKQNPETPPTTSPQLHAPRPKEMQRILQEHQQQMHTIEKDKKEMEEEKEKQRIAEEHRRSSQVEERVQTGQRSAPPPSPAAAMSPVGSIGLLEETPLVPGSLSVTSRGSIVLGLSEPLHASSEFNVPEGSDQFAEDSIPSSGGILDGNKSSPTSSSKVQAGARASSLRSAPQVKDQSRAPSPGEGNKNKSTSSAKD